MKNYDFKDLMAFGTFLLALLTFIFMFCKKFRHKNTAPKLWRVNGRLLSQLFTSATHLVGGCLYL